MYTEAKEAPGMETVYYRLPPRSFIWFKKEESGENE